MENLQQFVLGLCAFMISMCILVITYTHNVINENNHKLKECQEETDMQCVIVAMPKKQLQAMANGKYIHVNND